MDQPTSEKLVNDLTRNKQVGTDQNATWANSASANTAVNLDYTLPAALRRDAKYVVAVYNPSTVTALTVKPKNKADNFGAATRYPELTSLAVPVNSVKAFVVEGWMLDAGGRLTLSNDTVLGVSDGFTATVRVIAP